MSAHLCDERIRRLLGGTLPDDELVQAEAHLWQCLDCRDALRRWTEPTPDLPPLTTPRSEGAAPLPAWPVVPGYEILGELGRGGMAVVYRARQLRPNRVVALKVLRTGLPADARRRFCAESEALARLQHPGIVQVFEAGEHDGRPYFSLEFCGGGSLARKLAGTPMEPRQAAALVEAVTRAVAAAHRAGIVHRDLKPANILLHTAGDPLPVDSSAGTPSDKPARGPVPSAVPKVSDFGLAKLLTSGTAESIWSGAVLGTPSYVAPEQLDGAAGPTVDVYALGAILYECLTGRPPFQAATVLETLELVRSCEPVPPRQLRPGLSADLETICLKCLEKEPARRYVSALELAEDLQRFLNGQAVRARPVGPLERTRRRMRRHPLSSALAAALLLTVAGGLGLCGWLWYQAVASQKETEIARRDAEEHYFRTRRLLPDLVTASSGSALQSEERSRIRRATLERACDLYRELCQVRPDDSKLGGELAQVLTALAETAMSEGRYDSAAPAAEEALALWRRLQDEEPQELRWRRGAARALLHLAMARRFFGRSREAIDAYREAIGLLQALADEQPSAAGPLLDLVAARRDLAEAHFQELKFDEEQSLFEGNRRQLEAYRAAGADSVETRLALVETVYLLGLRYQDRGDAPAAVRCLRDGCRQSAALEIALPQDPRAGYFYAVCARGLPRGDDAALTPAQAIPRLERAVQLLEIRYALDPERAWRMLAAAARHLADCYLDAGRPADALRMERRAAEALPPRPDGIPFLELMRLEGKARVARREQQIGELEAARRHAQEVADGFEAFCRTHGADAALLDVAIDFIRRLAPPLRHAEAVDQSRRVVECALQIVQQKSSADADAIQLRCLAEVWTQMAKCRMQEGRDGVEAALREAVDAARRLVARRPEYRYLLDDRLARLARWLAECGRRPEAAVYLHQCEHLWDRNADGLRGVARNFRKLAEKVKNARQSLTNEEKAEREGYLAEAARLEKAANALCRHDAE
jgi:serine/threonine protein kinase